MSDKIHRVFGYFNGPVCGIASYEGGLVFFDAPFREDIDDYDKVFSILPLVGDDLSEALKVLRLKAGVTPQSTALYKELSQKLAAAGEAATRRLANVVCLGPGGLDGNYEVNWEPAA